MPGAPRNSTGLRERYVNRKADEELEDLLRTAQSGEAQHRAMVQGALGLTALPGALEVANILASYPEAHKNTQGRAYLEHTMKARGYKGAKAREMAEQVHSVLRGRHSASALNVANALTGSRGSEISRDQALVAIRKARTAFRAAGKRDPSSLSTLARTGLRRARLFGPTALLYGAVGAAAGKKLHAQRIKTLRAIHEDDD